MRFVSTLLTVSLLSATPLLAHEGAPHLSSAEFFWNVVTAVTLFIVLTLYLIGVRRLWKHQGGRKSIRRWQVIAFLSGCGSATIALLSKLDLWSDVLFSAHMAQHEILMLITAPLMVLGKPFIATLWGLPQKWRAGVSRLLGLKAVESTWERMSGPLFVLLLHAAVLWLWHFPTLFEAALHNESLHVVQHLTFFLTAALFWWALIHGRYGRLGYGIGVLYVFATAMSSEVLGALLTFAPHSWYHTHATRTAAAGIDPVADQQLAGIVMWIPFGMVFVVVALALFAAWLGEAERRIGFSAANELRSKES